MRLDFFSFSQPITFVALHSEHAQSDGKSVNRGLPLVLDLLRVEILAVNQKEHGLWGYAVSNIGSPSDFSWRTQILGAKACRVLADFFCRRAADFFVVELQIFLSGHQLAYTSRFFVTTNRVEAWGRVIHNQEWRLCH